MIRYELNQNTLSAATADRVLEWIVRIVEITFEKQKNKVSYVHFLSFTFRYVTRY